jgi:hypothetical protein
VTNGRGCCCVLVTVLHQLDAALVGGMVRHCPQAVISCVRHDDIRDLEHPDPSPPTLSSPCIAAPARAFLWRR